MKSFYPYTTEVEDVALSQPVVMADAISLGPALIAIYDVLSAPPHVEYITANTARDLIETLATRTYAVSHEQGGQVPYVVIRELVENFIHAGFDEVVVSVLESGNVIRFADQGPGIKDKDRVFLPGFTTATNEMKTVIKGVGSGLPVARECLTFSGGVLEIDDNLNKGTVITLRMTENKTLDTLQAENKTQPPPFELPVLTTRQKQVLSLTMELNSVGPTVISRELQVGLSTAYRDLEYLTEHGLVFGDSSGKRSLTAQGVQCLDILFGR